MSRITVSVVLLLSLLSACSIDEFDFLPQSKNNESIPQKAEGTIEYCSGYVESDGKPLVAGDRIDTGRRIKSAAGATCDLLFSTAYLRLAANSNLLVRDWQNQKDRKLLYLELESGLIACKGFHEEASGLLITTPSAVISGGDAQFSVLTDAYGTTKISVQNGTLIVSKRISAFDKEPSTLIDRGFPVRGGTYIIITPKQREGAENAYSEAKKKHTLPASALDEIRPALAITDKSRGNLDFAEFKGESVTIDTAGIDEPVKKGVDYSKNGSLTVTATDIYHSWGGKIIWKSPITAGPLRSGAYTLVAGNDRVYCATSAGHVVWSKNISYINEMSMQGRTLTVETSYGTLGISVPGGRLFE